MKHFQVILPFNSNLLKTQTLNRKASKKLKTFFNIHAVPTQKKKDLLKFGAS